MNINSFEPGVSKKIVVRGLDYFNDGSVTDIEQRGDYRYIASIKGTYTYEVDIQLDGNGEIVNSQCDCPYDMGPVCKHEVAVYFKLRDLLDKGVKIESKKSSATSDLKKALTALSKEELVAILLGMADKDERVKNSLAMQYTQMNEQESWEMLISSIGMKYQNEDGYISYRDVCNYTVELEELLEDATKGKDTMEALEIAGAVLEESIDAFQYSDDSNGDVGYLVEQSIEKIREIVQNRKVEDNQEMIMEWIIKQSENPELEGWSDYRIGLLSICPELADNVVLREKLRKLLESKLLTRGDDWSIQHRNGEVLEILYSLLKKYATEEEGIQFLLKHVSHSSFRKILIKMSMDAGDYAKAVDLALAGEKQDSEYPGLVSTWKYRRYDGYAAMGLVDEQKQLAYELLMAGEFSFYRELKKFAVGQEQELYDQLKQELSQDKNYRRQRLYLELIEAENDLAALLDYVKMNPSAVEGYMDRLIEDHRDEVISAFKEYVETEAEKASNRPQYKMVCQLLNRFGKVAGRHQEDKLNNELAILYKRKPAFVDELGN